MELLSINMIVLDGLSIVCAVSDMRRQKIYNRCTLIALLFGFIYHFAIRGLEGAMMSLGSVIIIGGFLLCFYGLGLLGAGDVKLGMAAAALSGYGFVFGILLLSSIIAGIIGVILWTFFDRKMLPFGVFFCIGTLCYQGILLFFN